MKFGGGDSVKRVIQYDGKITKFSSVASNFVNTDGIATSVVMSDGKVETGITSFAQVEEYKEKILSQGVSKFYTIYITVKPTNVIDDRENITFNYSSVLELKI